MLRIFASMQQESLLRWPAESLLRWPDVTFAEKAYVVVVVAFTVIMYPFFWQGFLIVEWIPGWFYAGVERNYNAIPMIIGGVVLLCCYLVATRINKIAIGIPLLVLGAYVFLMSVQSGHPSGLDASFEQIALNKYQNGFLHNAIAIDDPIWVLKNYDTFLSNYPDHHSPSKPPGHFLVYDALEFLSRITASSSNPGDRVTHLGWWLVWMFPLMTALTIWPLLHLTKRLWPGSNVYQAGVLYSLIPTTSVLVGALDHTIYPLLVVTSWAIAVEAHLKRSLLLWVGFGAVVWMMLFITFSLMPAVLLTVPVLAIASRRTNPQNIARELRLASTAVCSFFVLSLAAYVAFQYDPIQRFTSAMAFHNASLKWTGSAFDYKSAFAVNPTEFLLYLGPIASVGLAFLVLNKATWKPMLATGILTASFLTLFFFLLLTSGCRGEVIRIWFFFVPFVVLILYSQLQDRSRTSKWLLGGVTFVCSLISIDMLKRYMDYLLN